MTEMTITQEPIPSSDLPHPKHIPLAENFEVPPPSSELPNPEHIPLAENFEEPPPIVDQPRKREQSCWTCCSSFCDPCYERPPREDDCGIACFAACLDPESCGNCLRGCCGECCECANECCTGCGDCCDGCGDCCDGCGGCCDECGDCCDCDF